MLLSLGVSAAEPMTDAVSSSSKARNYGEVLRARGRDAAGQVSFFRAFNGLWPVPSNLVLLDSADGQLEYSDGAYPWDDVRAESIILYGGRASMERRWPDLFSRLGDPIGQWCSLQVRRVERAIGKFRWTFG